MKLDYLEMLHAEFEVSSLNSMAVREIIRWAKKIWDGQTTPQANWTVRSLENANWLRYSFGVPRHSPNQWHQQIPSFIFQGLYRLKTREDIPRNVPKINSPKILLHQTTTNRNFWCIPPKHQILFRRCIPTQTRCNLSRLLYPVLGVTVFYLLPCNTKCDFGTWWNLST